VRLNLAEEVLLARTGSVTANFVAHIHSYTEKYAKTCMHTNTEKGRYRVRQHIIRGFPGFGVVDNSNEELSIRTTCCCQLELSPTPVKQLTPPLASINYKVTFGYEQ
ncbi:hypothetical protein WUBG_03540, partial [Wuchereria bancrofti]